MLPPSSAPATIVEPSSEMPTEPPTRSKLLVSEGASYIISGEWWAFMFPGAALVAAVFSFNMLGDGLRDLLDPRKRV